MRINLLCVRITTITYKRTGNVAVILHFTFYHIQAEYRPNSGLPYTGGPDESHLPVPQRQNVGSRR